CFLLASGLKINLQKSKPMGIGIPHEDLLSAVESAGCSIFHTPFNFLGVKVGDIMLRRSSWEETIEAIYGTKGTLDISIRLPARYFPWLIILRKFRRLSQKDHWLSDFPLKKLYPRVFRLELEEHISVASKLRDMSLMSSFRRAPRGGIEEDQFCLLHASVAHILLCDTR
nr:RNA-directed DNA polymerase, eukaryota [Tanacetum cinerariifolium]